MIRVTDLMARWASKDPPAFSTWLPDYTVDQRGKVPEWVKADLRVGVDLRLVSQALFDTIRDLEEANG